nr:16S rRNA (guanine(527)-N(7))-methyltransferase RsmG [uncultured Actinotalea sp.]
MTEEDTLGGIGPDTSSIRALLGERLPAVERYARALTDHGVLRGLLGPRELPRLWERHLLNSAAVAPLLPARGVVVDLGSGAGLPGIVLACLRPDLSFVLVEPMLRRSTWLHEVTGLVGLENVEVRRARAEELVGELVVDAVTARAVAPLDRLASWALPLCRQGGELLALKGDRAEEELHAARPQLHALGGDDGEVVRASVVPEVPSTAVIRVRRLQAAAPQQANGRGGPGPGGRPAAQRPGSRRRRR